MFIDRLLHGWRGKRPVPNENFFREELHFVEQINIQRKAGWRIRKYKTKRGRTLYIIDSN
jgi:hypothetical protein